MDSVVINKIIVAIHPTQFGKVICIAFSDGTVQYRDRFSFNEIYHEINVNRIMTLHQVGFKFPDSVPCRSGRNVVRMMRLTKLEYRPPSCFLAHELFLCTNL